MPGLGARSKKTKGVFLKSLNFIFTLTRAFFALLCSSLVGCSLHVHSGSQTLAEVPVVVSDAPLPSDSASEVLAEEAVVIDKIEVLGSPNTTVGFLETYLDLPIGQPIPASLLQDHLSRFKLRLEALAYFKKIDLRLERGSVRNHFIVVVELEAISAFYGGIGANSFNETNLVSSSSGTLGKSMQEKVFFGTRDIGGSGLMSDIELRRDRFDLEQSEAKGHTITASLFHPAFLKSAYFGGVKISESRLKAKIVFSSIEELPQFPTGPYRLTVKSSNYELQWGRRFGLSSWSVLGGESRQETISSEDSNFDLSNRYVGARFNYSEKSYLAAVEPGSVIEVSIRQEIGSGSAITVAFENSQFISERQVLTPKLQSFIYKEQKQLYQTHLASLLYAWVSPWDWVMGVEPRSAFSSKERPTYGIKLSATYISASFLVNLNLAVGGSSFSDDPAEGQRGVLP